MLYWICSDSYIPSCGALPSSFTQKEKVAFFFLTLPTLAPRLRCGTTVHLHRSISVWTKAANTLQIIHAHWYLLCLCWQNHTEMCWSGTLDSGHCLEFSTSCWFQNIFYSCNISYRKTILSTIYFCMAYTTDELKTFVCTLDFYSGLDGPIFNLPLPDLKYKIVNNDKENAFLGLYHDFFRYCTQEKFTSISCRILSVFTLLIFCI